MNLIDLGIVLVLAFGIFIGWRNGLIGPLLAQGTFLIGYWIVSRNPGLAALVPPSIPRAYAVLILPAVVGLVVGIVGRTAFQAVFRLPFTRSVDKLLGAVANGALAFVILYVVLLGFVGAGTVLDPLASAAVIREPQVAAMQMLLKNNPQVATLVPSAELGQLSNVASVRALPIDQLGQYAQVINYYEHTLRPQLTTSALAPIILRLGARLPIIGRPATIPKA
ncbi:MAG TPA: CvpA family protein [Candidatus Dormibacteraeota bacterium]